MPKWNKGDPRDPDIIADLEDQAEWSSYGAHIPRFGNRFRQSWENRWQRTWRRGGWWLLLFPIAFAVLVAIVGAVIELLKWLFSSPP